MSYSVFGTFAVLLVLGFSVDTSAQNKRRKPPAKPAAPVTEKVVDVPTAPVDAPAKVATKRNERPAAAVPAVKTAAGVPVYFYEFSQPSFQVRKLRIEHDEAGLGKISFQKLGSEEMITDPLALSNTTLERLKTLFSELNFLESSEEYQSKRDYKHLGVVTLRMKKDGRERSTVYNWTENKAAADLAAEYRKIGSEAVWLFDFNVARDNQPLQTPGMMDALDSLLRRKEISDPAQLIPFLQKARSDERIPLMGRNRAAKILAEIEKVK